MDSLSLRLLRDESIFLAWEAGRNTKIDLKVRDQGKMSQKSHHF